MPAYRALRFLHDGATLDLPRHTLTGLARAVRAPDLAVLNYTCIVVDETQYLTVRKYK